MPPMTFLPRFPALLTTAVCCGGLFLLGDPRSVGATPTPAPAATPAKATSFDAVTARLDRGGSFYLYLSTADWLDHLSGHVTEWRDLYLKSLPKDQQDSADSKQIEQGFGILAKLIKESGLEQITGFGASSVALEPGLNRNVSFVHHDKGADMGLLGTAFGSAPHALTALDLLPADTAYGHYGDLDLSRILRTVYDALENSGLPDLKRSVDSGLMQFQAMSGMSADDALQSLGGAEGIVLTLDPVKTISVQIGGGDQKTTLPLPRLALLLPMNDDKIFARLDQTLGMLPTITKVNEPGLRMRTMAFPLLPDFTVRPTVAQWGKVLVIASDDGLIRDVIAAQKSDAGFKAGPEFAKLSAGMPTEGNGFTVLTQRFGDTIKRVQTEMVKQQAGSAPDQAALLEKLYAGQNTGSNYTVSAHVEDGWLSVSKGARSMTQILAPLAIVPVGIAAGMAVPVFNAVQEKGKATKSEAQAKQIVLACKLYASDNDGKFPPTLDALTPTYCDPKVFISPFAPDEAMGYTYTPGLTEKSPVGTVVVEDKFSGKEHQRVVAHVDGSAEVKKMP